MIMFYLWKIDRKARSVEMFGRTVNNTFSGIDCFGQIYRFGDVLPIVSSHVETVCLMSRKEK